MYTWHGTPDVRVRGAEVVVEYVDEGDEIDLIDSDGRINGATSNIEAKILYNTANLPQVISICVVSYFTKAKLHPDKQPLVPTVLIDQHKFRVCLYDCEKGYFINIRIKISGHKRSLIKKWNGISMNSDKPQVKERSTLYNILS